MGSKGSSFQDLNSCGQLRFELRYAVAVKFGSTLPEFYSGLGLAGQPGQGKMRPFGSMHVAVPLVVFKPGPYLDWQVVLLTRYKRLFNP
jgi:hypothetical protein